MSNTEKLIRMSGQIATFFATQPNVDGAAQVAAHINDFWAPPMRAELHALITQGHSDLHPLVVQADQHLRLPA